MIIYTLITQSIYKDGHHVNLIDNFENLEEAKSCLDSRVASQKTLEGDVFAKFELTDSTCEYGWLFEGKIVYGIELQRALAENNIPGNDIISTKRFIIPTLTK